MPMKRILLLLILGVSLVGNAQSLKQNFDETSTHLKGLKLIKSELFSVPKDLKEVFVYPIKNPNQTLRFSGLTLALVATDIHTTDFIQDKINPIFPTPIHKLDYLPVSGESESLIAGIVGLYGVSLISKSEKGQAAAILSLKAGMYSYIYSHLVLKSIFGRSRPVRDLDHPENSTFETYTDNPWDFGNIHRPYFNSRSEYTGFPSFHFTMAFSIAKTLQRVYDNYWIPYGICAAILLPNFQGHNHWTSDMVGGALIGTMIGNVIADNYFGIEKPQKNYSLQPLIGNQCYGASYCLTF
jgi:membrane-associated phospholipid phosphatase